MRHIAIALILIGTPLLSNSASIEEEEETLQMVAPKSNRNPQARGHIGAGT